VHAIQLACKTWLKAAQVEIDETDAGDGDDDVGDAGEDCSADDGNISKSSLLSLVFRILGKPRRSAQTISIMYNRFQRSFLAGGNFPGGARPPASAASEAHTVGPDMCGVISHCQVSHRCHPSIATDLNFFC
jgi:hypothetical protein